MKKHDVPTLLITGILISLLLVMVDCGKSVKKTPAEQLLELINENPGIKIKIKTEPARAIVKPSENGQYIVTFKNSLFFSDILMIFKTIPQYSFSIIEPFPEVEGISAEELVFLFGPKDKYLCLLSIKGILFEWDWAKVKRKTVETGVRTVKVAVGNAIFEDWRIAIQSDSKKEMKKITNDESLKKNGQGAKALLENIRIDIHAINQKREKISSFIEIEKLKLCTKWPMAQDVVSCLNNNNEPVPDFGKIIREGQVLADSDIELNKINFAAKINDIQLVKGILESSLISVFLKPDGTGSFFRYGIELSIKNAELSIPGNRILEMLGNIKECRIGASFENLSPELVSTIFEWFRSGIKNLDKADAPKGTQEMTAKIFKMLSLVLMSKPVLRLSLSPFIHQFGEVLAEAKVKIHTLFPPPPIEYELKILKIDDIFKKLEETKLFSPATLNRIRMMIEKAGVKDKNGNITIKGVYN